jgi:hypothetical protein
VPDYEDFLSKFQATQDKNKPPPPPRLQVVVNGSAEPDSDGARRYALAALRNEAHAVATAAPGSRNDTLNQAAFNLASFVTGGQLTHEEAFGTLTDAATQAGLELPEIAATLRSGERGSAAKVGARQIPERPADDASGREISPSDPDAPAAPKGRVIRQIGAGDVSDDVPTWAWSYGGKGRIQLGTLALWAGRPGAGKSSAARWWAAEATRGRLDGIWYGQPQRVAYIAPAEESLRYTIKPGLRAVDADLSRVWFPQVFHDDEPTRLLALTDEQALTELLLASETRVVIVDPLMSTIGSNVDIHRNNETRAYVEPWARIADAIGGVVLGVVHLRKDAAGDPVAAINGSSAFGEVARAVFGFAKDPESDEGDRVMSQAKNSTGEEDLALTYRIAGAVVRTDTGAEAEVGRFEITGQATTTVGEILSGGFTHADAGAAHEARLWLEDYLTEAGKESSKNVKLAARKEGFSERTVQRAATKLSCVIESLGFPRVTYWSLPVAQSRLSGTEQSGQS